MGGLGQSNEPSKAACGIKHLFAIRTSVYASEPMKIKRKATGTDDFIAPARRAFRRVKKHLRLESARLGLPLIERDVKASKPTQTARTAAR